MFIPICSMGLEYVLTFGFSFMVSWIWYWILQTFPPKKTEVWIYLFVRICHKKSCSQLYGDFGIEKRLVTCWVGHLRAVKTLGFGWFFAWYWMFIVGGSIFIHDWSSHIKSHSYTTWSLVSRCLVWFFWLPEKASGHHDTFSNPAMGSHIPDSWGWICASITSCFVSKVNLPKDVSNSIPQILSFPSNFRCNPFARTPCILRV